MTNKEILQLAEQHFDYQGGWIAYSKEDLLEFARAIRKQTIDPYSVKKEAIDEYRMDTIEERLTRIEDKVDLLITQLKIEFYKKNDGTSR
jgi:hypothetical protein